MKKDSNSIKLRIIAAGHKAVDELIKVAEESIIGNNNSDTEISADKLKNAAATKKLAIFDAFDILSRIELENQMIESIKGGVNNVDNTQGFAERRSNK
jgi:hypothetical protein